MSSGPSRLSSALLVALIGVVLAVPLVEIAARLLRLAPPVRVIDVTHDDTVYMRSENPILGFELKPDWSDPDADCMRSYPSTNSHGQRDVDAPVQFAALLALPDQCEPIQVPVRIRDRGLRLR